MITIYMCSPSHIKANAEEIALSDSCTRSFGRSAQCDVDDVSGSKLGVIHSLLIPMLIYTRKLVASAPVSDLASRRSFALPAACTVMEDAFGFSELR